MYLVIDSIRTINSSATARSWSEAQTLLALRQWSKVLWGYELISDPWSPDFQLYNGYTLLVWANQNGHLASIREIILNTRDSVGLKAMSDYLLSCDYTHSGSPFCFVNTEVPAVPESSPVNGPLHGTWA